MGLINHVGSIEPHGLFLRIQRLDDGTDMTVVDRLPSVRLRFRSKQCLAVCAYNINNNINNDSNNNINNNINNDINNDINNNIKY